VVEGVLFDGIQRSISAGLEISFRGVPNGDRAVVDRPERGFDRRQGTSFVQVGDDLLGCGPIAGIEGSENALAPPFSFNNPGLLGKVAAAPDGALANIQLLVLFRGGATGVRLAFSHRRMSLKNKSKVSGLLELLSDWI
jgi:hypothetical protein